MSMFRGRSFLAVLAILVLAGCAGRTPTATGHCQVSRCTGVCTEQVEQFAREKLGSEARGVYFSWDGAGGGFAAASGGTAYFKTEACQTGEYRLNFFGNARSCSNTFFGRVPNFVGELLSVPEGCAGAG